MTLLIRVLVNFTRMTFAALLARANAVYAGLNLNPDYPNPPVPMSEFRLAIDEFSAAATAALDGGAKAIAVRNTLGERVQRMLRQLAHYVEANCKGDVTTVLSSGFQTATAARIKTHPVSESIRKIEPGNASGEVRIVFVRAPGAVSYEARWAPIAPDGSPGGWTNQSFAQARAKTPLAGLTPGTTYVFQARAVTRSGVTEWGDPLRRICT